MEGFGLADHFYQKVKSEVCLRKYGIHLREQDLYNSLDPNEHVQLLLLVSRNL